MTARGRAEKAQKRIHSQWPGTARNQFAVVIEREILKAEGRGARSVREMKREALHELEFYEKFLKEDFTDRRMSFAEGMLTGFCAIGLIREAEGTEWLHRLRRTKKA